jgi:hypothetical protein
MSGTNLLRPTQNPTTRFGQPGTPLALTGPQMPVSALRVPPPAPAPVNAPAPVQPPLAAPAMPAPPPVPPVPAPPAPPAVAPSDRVSARVPVPHLDFHPDEHPDLHKAMGVSFDKPEASQFVREAYDAVRAAHPHIAPRAALLTARDAWHAVQHGFIDHGGAHNALRSFPALFAERRGHSGGNQ